MYELFENANYISEENVKLLTDFISSNLIIGPLIDHIISVNTIIGPNFIMFANGEKNMGFALLQKSERQFVGGKLVNFFADKAHKNCICLTV